MAAQYKAMTADVSTKESALTWLTARIRKLGLVFLVGVVASPVASAIVVGWRVFRRTKEFPPFGQLIGPILMWSAIVIVLMALVMFMILGKYIKFAKRVRPILEHGTQSTGSVVNVQESARKGGGVNFYKTTLTIDLGHGESVMVGLEESEGTDLPKVEPGAPAVVWRHGGAVVAGTSGSLFEGA